MRHCKQTQLKKTILLSLEEFQKAVQEVAPNTTVHCSLDGVWYETTPDTPDMEEEYLRILLARYFDVFEITSIHIDDNEYVGVWLVYEENRMAGKTSFPMDMDTYSEMVNTIYPHTYVTWDQSGCTYERDDGFTLFSDTELLSALAAHLGVKKVVHVSPDKMYEDVVWFLVED